MNTSPKSSNIIVHAGEGYIPDWNDFPSHYTYLGWRTDPAWMEREDRFEKQDRRRLSRLRRKTARRLRRRG